MKIRLITNCTATQSAPAHKTLQGVNLPRPMTTAETSEEWANRLSAHSPSIAPKNLYRGISFHSILRAQTIIGADNIHIVSIGQGLVGLEQPIVPYDLSIDPQHQHSLAKVITEESFQPTFWWRLINEVLERTPTSLAELSQGCDLMIVACSARFLTLINEDLTEIVQDATTMDKLRIVSTSSNTLTSVLKPYVLPYDRRLNLMTVGNRNDLNQRAALHFLKMVAEDEKVGSLEQHVTAVRDALNAKAPEAEGRGSQISSVGLVALKKLLDSNKDLLEMDPDEALAAVKMRHGIAIGPIAFRKEYRKAKGITLGKSNLKAVMGGADSKAAALSALAGIAKDLDKPRGTVTSYKDEEAALGVLMIFVEAVREANPDARFSSTEVYTWAQQYFNQLGGQVPTQLTSVNKLAHLLKAYYTELGLVSVLTGQGGNVYKLADGTEEVVDESEPEGSDEDSAQDHG